MVASSALQELSAVLARIESSGREVRRVAIDEDLTGADEPVTAELSVGVPVVPDGDASDGVSITAEDATVENGRVAVDLTVTVSGADATTEDTTPRTAGREQSSPGAGSVPAYKDPDALRSAYEEHDTFPAMREALGVDVTSETVRRHMVKYDIHDPEATAPGQPATREPPAERAGESGPETAVEAPQSESADDDTESGSDSPTEPERVTQSAVTDGGKAAVAESGRPRTASDPTPVVDLLAERTSDPRSDFGLAESVTVGDLTDAINRSRTVHELAREVGLSQAAARELLRAFDLINFVTHPLATEQVTVSADEVRRRLGPAGR